MSKRDRLLDALRAASPASTTSTKALSRRAGVGYKEAWAILSELERDGLVRSTTKHWGTGKFQATSRLVRTWHLT